MELPGCRAWQTSLLYPRETLRSRRSRPHAARLAPDRCRGPGRVSVAALRRVRKSCRHHRLLEQLAGDHDALDLVGALVDLAGLGVAYPASHRIVLEIPVTPEHLKHVQGH